MAVEFDHKGHQQLWFWLAQNPTEEKPNWPGWNDFKEGKEPLNLCFACEAAAESDFLNCAACPLHWPDGQCMSENGSPFLIWRQLGELYRRFRFSADFAGAERALRARAEIAYSISALPLKRGG